ncbi:MAG TPA: hypothetical protein PK400_07715 [Phycisphaerales bacterium]|nr:hypothetical protein [Phycisphaerales bacterium]
MVNRPAILVTSAILLSGCASAPPNLPPPTPEAMHQVAIRELQIERIEQRDPTENNFIWMGRRLAYLGHYEDAIAEFTHGLERYPSSFRLLRHRGHRWITLRRFDLAVDDLSLAASLIEGVPDEVEPDGLPNARNIPTSTSHTNIYYHLGLAHYLRGEFDSALAAYEQCMAFSKNDDMRVATAYWLMLTQRRLGMNDAAGNTLAPFHPSMDIIENRDYLDLLMLFKHGLTATFNEHRTDHDSPLPEGVNNATRGYGLGMWWMLEQPDGERMARNLFRRVVNNTPPAAFGHIAAEVELTRLGN